jgi:hypothetical protein
MIKATFEELETEAGEIQEYLKIECSGDPEEIKERLTTLSVYNARTGKMYADAKYILAGKLKGEFSSLIEQLGKSSGLTAKAINKLIDCMSKDEQYLVDCIERINRATVHQIDVLRSLLSYEKEQIRNTPNLK